MQCKDLDIPLEYLFGDSQVLEVQVISADAQEQLDKILACWWSVRAHLFLPVFELPSMSIHKDRNNTLPLLVCEARHWVVHLKQNFLPVIWEPVFHHYFASVIWAGTIISTCVLLVEYLVSAFLQEWLCITEGKVACEHGAWDDDDWHVVAWLSLALVTEV